MQGGVTMNTGSIYDWRLASLTTTGPGTNFDEITLTVGTSSLGSGKANLDFGLLPAGQDPNGSNAFWRSSEQWQIVTATGGTLSGKLGLTNPKWRSGEFSMT